MAAPSAWTQLLAELKRRRVFRVAAVYLAASFIVLQAAPSLFQALLLPDWAFRLLVVLLILGFIVAVPLAWAYDVGPGGIQRTPPAHDNPAGNAEPLLRVRWWLVAIAGFMVLALVGGGWLALRARGPVLDPHRVMVGVFENRTGDSTYNALGHFAADYITQGLAETEFAVPIDARGMPGVWRDSASDPRVVRRLAAETRAGTVVQGRYYLLGDSIRIDAQIVDARDGHLVRSVEPVGTSRTSVESGVERLREQVLGAVAANLASWFTSWEKRAKDRAPSYAAYRSYSAGLDAYTHAEPMAAAPAFEQAAALDTTFLAPRIWAAMSHMLAYARVEPDRAGAARQRVLADSLAAEVERRRARLDEYDRYFFDLFLSWRRLDAEGMYAAATRMLESAPGSVSALKELAFAAAHAGHPREALGLLERLNPEHRYAPEFEPDYWLRYLESAHWIGAYDLELEHARIALRLQPAVGHCAFSEIRALVALGRVAEAERLIERREALDGDGIRKIGLEMRVHGHADASRRTLLRALAWVRAQPAREPGTPAWIAARTLEADALFELGREADARPLYEQLARTDSFAYWPRGRLGIIAAHAGDLTTTRRLYAGLLADTLVLAPPDGMGLFLARAIVATAAGDRDAAVLRTGDLFPGVRWLYGHILPDFDPLRRYPPFETLLRPRG